VTGKSELLGKDLKLEFAGVGADLSISPAGDLKIADGIENLTQAIISRLSTSKGELYDIGHPNYGSRLYELFGQPNSETTRKEISKAVFECLAEETRIKEVIEVSVKTDLKDPNCLNVGIIVIPIERNIPLSLVYPFNLEVE
jgi:phage baseplate assembly protein W